MELDGCYLADGSSLVDNHTTIDHAMPNCTSHELYKGLLDGKAVAASDRVYLALHKPRGLVTTAADEKGRATVYRCFVGANLPWLAPVGPLDKASE